jgi:segregation and condensation protein B
MFKEINLLEEKVKKSLAPSDTTRKKEISRIIEALLFATSDPLSLSKIKEVVELSYPLSLSEIRTHIENLKEEYKREKRGFRLDEIAEGYLLRTAPDLFPYVEALHRDRRGEKLSKAAMEVLAIIAFKQPITRGQVESIRGVDSSGTLSSLMERGLIEVKGKLDAPGRPSQYGTTKGFLKHFGLKDFQQLSGFFTKKEG